MEDSIATSANGVGNKIDMTTLQPRVIGETKTQQAGAEVSLLGTQPLKEKGATESKDISTEEIEVQKTHYHAEISEQEEEKDKTGPDQHEEESKELADDQTEQNGKTKNNQSEMDLSEDKKEKDDGMKQAKSNSEETEAKEDVKMETEEEEKAEVKIDSVSEEKKDSHFYEDRIKELKDELLEVANETHQDMREELATLKKQRDRILRDADMLKELRMQEVDSLYDYEVMAAEDSFKTDKETIKSKLAAQIEETMKKLEDLKNGVNLEDSRRFKRTLRSKTKGDNNDFEALEFEKSSRQRKSNDGIGLSFFMDEEDIIKDLQEIQSNWQQAAEKFSKSNGLKQNTAKINDKTLIYNDMQFSEGDNIVVQTEITKEELIGKISCIHDNEINITLIDDSKARLLLSHLESGRCKISKYQGERMNII